MRLAFQGPDSIGAFPTLEDIFEIQNRYDAPTSDDHLPLSTKTTPLLPVTEAESLCSSNGHDVFHPRNRQRKVYDLFLLGAELDWLEIRLNELWEEVDYFVIVESSRTFTYHPKPLFFKEYLDKHAQDPSRPNCFTRFLPKIIYRVVSLDHLPPSRSTTAWDREKYQRDALFTAVFPSLIGDQAAIEGDVVLLSDTDEIPRPSSLQLLRNCDFPDRYTLQTKFYYYSFQWHHKVPPPNEEWSDWFHPQATSFKGLNDTILPSSLRNPVGTPYLPDAGWHCSTCFRTLTETLHKIASFSHIDYNLPKYRDPQEIVRKVREGKDLFDRKSEQFERIEDNQDIPRYIMKYSERFKFMLDRDGKNAAFEDYSIYVEDDVEGSDGKTERVAPT